MIKPFFVAMQNRSGSSWLCWLLRSTGNVGSAGEIPASIHRSYPESKALVQYWKERKNTRHGFKINWSIMNRLEKAMREAGDYVEEYEYIWLRRKNLWAQAVSTSIAIQSKWGADIAEPMYNEEAIVRYHRKLIEGEHWWKNWFCQHLIRPMTITYEYLCESTEKAVNQILRHVDCEELTKSLDYRINPYRTAQTTEWADRLRKKYESDEANQQIQQTAPDCRPCSR